MKLPVRPHLGNERLDRYLTDLQATLTAIAASPLGWLAEARLVGPVAIATTDTVVPHSLGRPPRGYVVVKQTANAVVYDGAVAPRDANTALSLRASAATTATLLVF